MTEGMLAIFIPIVMFLVTGLVLVTYFYLRSRERQMLIEKGLSAEDIKQFFESKKDPYALLKWGIIITAAGLGIGLGIGMGEEFHKDYWTPLFIFTFTGLGMVIANILGNKLSKKYKQD
ncbi:MAG: hypothetical protein Kow0098_12280 [Ignavibacteriaceae bacterium]